jgi:hypothetical protein
MIGSRPAVLVAPHTRHVAECEIDLVDQQVEDHAQRAARCLWRVPEADDVHRFAVEEAAHRCHDRVEPLHEAAHEWHAVAFRAQNECPAGGQVRRYRFLHENRLAKLQQGARGVRVEGGGGRDHRRIAVCRGAQILGKRAPKPFGKRSNPLGIGVDDDCELGAFGLGDYSRVVRPHRPGSDQCNSGTSTHGRSLSPPDLPDRRFAALLR